MIDALKFVGFVLLYLLILGFAMFVGVTCLSGY